MSNLRSEIEKLVAGNDLRSALNLLFEQNTDGNVSNEIIVLRSAIDRQEKESRRGVVDLREAEARKARIMYAILELLTEIEKKSLPSQTDDAKSTDAVPITVFLSYSRADIQIARRITRYVESRGITVRIDEDALSAGDNIRRFIERSIRETDVTVSIVSNESLLSTWVAMETVNTFHAQKFCDTKRFIACFVDPDFLDVRFRLYATKKIDAKIREIDELIPRYSEQRVDTNDLNEQKSRLYELRNSLGDILKHLRESSCLDIRSEASLESLVEAITSMRE